jgi:transposase
VNSQKFLQE